MKRRRHQHPPFARLRIGKQTREHRVLHGVARLFFRFDAITRDAESLKLTDGKGSFRALIEKQGVVAAGKEDACVWIAACQFGSDGDALGRSAERHIAPPVRYARQNRTAEHDDAVGRSARGIPLRKTLLQRQDQRVAERRQPGNGNENNARHHEPARESPELCAQKNKTGDANCDQQIRRNG